MTKRILAAFLAVMMVATLIPTSVFAANTTECAVLEQYGDHSKVHCDNAGVTYTVVPNSTVEAECGQDGYTLYQCACGEYFADDLIPMEPHHTESGEPKTARVEPTCFATGKAAVFTCDECGKDYFDPTDPDADSKGVIAKTPHTFDQVSYPSNDCTDSERVCQNEGCTAKDTTHRPQTAHKWVYADPEAIVKAPTAHDEGEAVFHCGNDGCAQTKTVVVKALDHKSSMKWVAEVARGTGCEDTGVKGHWHCAICDKNYIELPSGELVEADDEMLTIPAVGHTWSDEPYVFPATCTTWGFEYYGCQVCLIKGESKDLAPLGHTTYEQAVAHDADEDLVAVDGLWITTTPGDCTTATKYEWTCQNFANGKDGALCGHACSKKDAIRGHKEARFSVPATDAVPYSYTVVYCTNEFCSKSEIEEAKVTISGTAVTLDLTVDVKDGDVYDQATSAPVKFLRFENAKKVTNPTGHFFESRIINAPTCTDAGKKFVWCVGCNKNEEVDAEALGHLYETTEEGLLNDTPAGCYTDAVLGCDFPGCGHMETLIGTAAHTWAETKSYTIEPTCAGGKGYDVYECTVAGCTETDLRNETVFVENLSYDTVEQAQAQHPGLSTNFEVLKEGDCNNFGYWEYACSDCGKNVLVKIAGTGLGHIRPDTTAYYAEATCTQFKGWAAYRCARCNASVAAEIEQPALGHNMKETPKKAATCLEGGNHQYFTCSNKGCEDIIYKTKNGQVVYQNDEHLIPALGHAYSNTVVEATCTTPGFAHHICGNCKDEYVDAYVAPLGHTRGAAEKLEATCTTAGYDNIKCGRAECDEYYSEKELPATGHKNKSGQTIVDICTDTVTDRVCVNKNCPITPVNNKKTVAKSHTFVRETVAPGCEHFGYTMETCANGCGQKDKVTGIVEPVGHLTPWGTNIKEGDMSVIDEAVVAPYVEAFLNTDPAQYTGHITAYTAPTYEALGSISFTCEAHCGDELTRDVIRYGVDFTMEVDNAAVAGANYILDAEGNVIEFVPVDGDVIAVDLYLNAYKTDVWGFNFDVSYSKDALNYLGYVYHAADKFGVSKANKVVAADAAKVSISAYTENLLDGKPTDVAVEGTVKVATLYFQVEALYMDANDVAQFAYRGLLKIENAWMSNTDIEERCDGVEIAFNISELLDTNKNKVFNIKDLQNCYEIIKGLAEVEYMAAADANKDGVVDLKDMDLMNKYLVGEATILDVYAQLTWTAPEGFIAAN